MSTPLFSLQSCSRCSSARSRWARSTTYPQALHRQYSLFLLSITPPYRISISTASHPAYRPTPQRPKNMASCSRRKRHHTCFLYNWQWRSCLAQRLQRVLDGLSDSRTDERSCQVQRSGGSRHGPSAPRSRKSGMIIFVDAWKERRVWQLVCKQATKGRLGGGVVWVASSTRSEAAHKISQHGAAFIISLPAGLQRSIQSASMTCR